MTGARPKFAAVCFDCDGTLTRIEGIDELARRSGRDAEIAPLTAAAMDGTLSIEDVYARRLEIVRPDRDALEWLGERYVEELVDGAGETVAALQRLGKSVYVVSGGLLQPVTKLAEALAIAPDNVRAVAVHLDSAGRYQGFDTNSPLVRSDGKAEICRALATRHGPIAVVGDGVTDLAAHQSRMFMPDALRSCAQIGTRLNGWVNATSKNWLMAPARRLQRCSALESLFML